MRELANTSPPILAVDNVGVSLGNATFGPFQFSVSRKERIAIIGPSGAGKSTLLSLISRERLKGEGQLFLHQQAIEDYSLAELSQIRAVLPQQHDVAFGFECKLIVQLGRVSKRFDPQLGKIVQSAAKLAQAEHLLNRRFDSLSGGEKARIHLARVFAQLWDVEGGLLLVDEPLSALDPGLQLSLMASIQQFVAEREHGLVAILHDMNQAIQHFDQILMIQSGQQFGYLPASPLIRPALETLYGIQLETALSESGTSLLVPKETRHMSELAA
ncbi:ATP-binding cassette domain-containing protein [Leeia sp. TBRC 13508]|uniref:ATP-binding cassette domain-containing protein n=1 Tax=Leeia speluncae TaxID=2884804 RepID=A0ABS8D6V4_9NEIS|nr:ATP-binding cassette domain-containing protein [Leeia speluncae]MCB6183923.1 ATP-binding cassette domain-containing protein [Leeia speluncae]